MQGLGNQPGSPHYITDQVTGCGTIKPFFAHPKTHPMLYRWYWLKSLAGDFSLGNTENHHDRGHYVCACTLRSRLAEKNNTSAHRLPHFNPNLGSSVNRHIINRTPNVWCCATWPRALRICCLSRGVNRYK